MAVLWNELNTSCYKLGQANMTVTLDYASEHINHIYISDVDFSCGTFHQQNLKFVLVKA